MDPPPISPAAADPCPNPRSNVYQIGGVPVEFPYKPYGTQLAFMGRVISALERSRRQGNSHALLESPTGTGKSLSLLCSTLAWQQHQLRRGEHGPASAAATTGSSDHLVYGGGFVPEAADPEPSKNTEQTPEANKKIQKRNTVPTIYYASRTQSQITQVIREYRKTSYRVPMAVLGSRKRYCANKKVCSGDNVDEECKNLMKHKDLGCPMFKNVQKVKTHPSLRNGGCHEVHDVEDLVNIGHRVKGCSYYAAQDLAAEAKLIFCPYSYVINPTVRKAMDIDIRGSILILDEAHNMEDVSREAGSVDIEEDALHSLQNELGQLCETSRGSTYQPLYDMVQEVISWIDDRKSSLQRHDFERFISHWTGDKAIAELQRAGITQHHFPILHECATKAIKDASDVESDDIHLSGVSILTLDGFCTSLSYLFSTIGCHATDYQLVLQRYVKRGNASSEWTCSLGLWCLNPAIVFREISSLCCSVILTSGTLSPMSSFASELGVQFETCMEAPHVVDMDSQLWAAVIPSGFYFMLNASYKTADSFSFQDELGATIEEICKIVPGGALIFFPSYKLLEKLQNRWCQTGQWDRFNDQKPVYVEPRGNADELEPILRGYYESIHGNRTISYGKSKCVPGRATKRASTKLSENTIKGAAALLAVCRGKVSEGIDFSDDNARVVVIVGIPFRNVNDIQVVLKKKYNDSYRASKKILSGSDWYCHQAFRALNQAAGRCIRHKSDYGAVILLDERYKEERNLVYISKWLRKSIREYDSFDRTLKSLHTFFEIAEKRFRLTRRSPLEDECIIDVDDENLNSVNAASKNKRLAHENRNQKIKVINKKIATSADKKSKKSFCSSIAYGDLDTSCENTDEVEGDFTLPARYLEDAEIGSSPSHPTSSSEAYNYESAKFPSAFIEKFPFSYPPDQPNKSSSNSLGTTVTPEKQAYSDISNHKLGSCSNLSVNSSVHKRRKVVDLELSDCVKMVPFSSPGPECCWVNDKIRNTSKDTNLVEQELDISCSICRFSFGVYEKDYLVSCSQTSTSKSFVRRVLSMHLKFLQDSRRWK